MKPELGLVESAWFFRRGEQSVRIVRVSHPNLTMSLRVDGPGAVSRVHQFDDQAACALQQSAIERKLMRRAFYLERRSDRPAPPPRARASQSAGLRILFDQAPPQPDSFPDPPAAA